MTRSRFKVGEHAKLAHDFYIKGVIQKRGREIIVLGVGDGSCKIELNRRKLWVKQNELEVIK